MDKSADRIKPSDMPPGERKRVRVQMDRDLAAANARETRERKNYKSFDEYETQSPVRAVSRRIMDFEKNEPYQYKKGGSVKSSASRRADGIAQRGKTKGRFV